MDLGLLVGLLGIGLGLFLGLFFGLSGFRKGVTDKLSDIETKIVAIEVTVEKAWDLVMTHYGAIGGTVERELDNLGKIKITAEPSVDTTTYIIEISRPIFKEGPLSRKFKEEQFLKTETQLLGREGIFYVLSPIKLRYVLHNTDPRACTEFITFLLKELDSSYLALLGEAKDFEGPILP